MEKREYVKTHLFLFPIDYQLHDDHKLRENKSTSNKVRAQIFTIHYERGEITKTTEIAVLLN